jgi:hypothetical protein
LPSFRAARFARRLASGTLALLRLGLVGLAERAGTEIILRKPRR